MGLTMKKLHAALLASLLLIGCGHRYPIHSYDAEYMEPTPVTSMDNISNSNYYTNAAEICFKGVTYVIFAPMTNGAVGSVEVNQGGQPILCGTK